MDENKNEVSSMAQVLREEVERYLIYTKFLCNTKCEACKKEYREAYC